MKILIIRFSSIGDIVLCTPVIRVLGKQSGNEVQIITKSSFAGVLVGNPYLEKIHIYEKEVEVSYQGLKAEKFDLVVDMHKNLRSKRLVRSLGVPSLSFDKINLKKWLAVNFDKRVLPEKHLVDRYFEGIATLEVHNDGLGLDFYPEDVPKDFILPDRFVCLSLGAAHLTKVIPDTLIKDLLAQIQENVILIGGPDDKQRGEELSLDFKHVYNSAGELSVRQSGYVIQKSMLVITPDTGMMHIAAALKKPIISVWGNTVPEFGMYPYYGDSDVQQYIAQVDINCRPCSKIGFKKCPKGHFKCMQDQDLKGILGAVKEMLN